MTSYPSHPLRLFLLRYGYRIIVFILLVLMSIIPDLFLYLFPQLSDILIALIQSVLFTFILSYFYRFYHKQLRVNNPSGFGEQKISGKLIMFAILIFLAIEGVNIIFLEYIEIEQPENQLIIEEIFLYFPISMTLSTVIAMPIAEELLFRGIFFNYFFTKNTYGFKALAIISSALLFGLIHEPTFSLALLFYASIGVLLAIAYVYTKNIFYPILIHICYNAIAVIGIFWV